MQNTASKQLYEMENRPIRKRSDLEDQMVRRREKEMLRAEKWNSTVKYYDKMQKHNSKFEEWTSPRYFEENNELVDNIRKKRDKEELLEKRRLKLKNLLEEDQKTYDIELVMKNRDSYRRRSKLDDIPVEILKDITDGCKLEEETRRRHEAEQNLYRHWRGNNSVLTECQRRNNTKDLKLSWLDQQIEKRMAKEKEAEMTRKFIKEREKFIEEQKLKEQEIEAEHAAKNIELSEFLTGQMNELLEKEQHLKELHQAESIQRDQEMKFTEILSRKEEIEKQRKLREIQLFNVKQHQRKLKLRSEEIEKQLKDDLDIIKEIQCSELVEKIASDQRRTKVKDDLEKYLKLLRELQDLERKRKPHISFTFESEAKNLFEKLEPAWLAEQQLRKELKEQVFQELKAQILANLQNNKEKQKSIVTEREEMLKSIEKYNDEMKEIKNSLQQKKDQYKRDLDEQIKENVLRKRKLDNLEKRRTDSDLDRIKKDEERLRREIARIDLNKAPLSFNRRKFNF